MVDYVTHNGHILVRNDVFTLMQGDLAKFEPYQPAVDPDTLVLDKIWRMAWATNEVPFMLLVPMYTPFYGPLFQRLNYTHRSFPLHMVTGGGWCLVPEVVQEWRTLERNMHHLFVAMIDVSNAPLPRFFRYWALPKRYGYELHYRSRRDAQIIASRSRDSFIPLMAALTLMLLIMDDLTTRKENFKWRDTVLQKTGIHPQWLAELEKSVVGDFDSPRVGGIINFTTCEFQWLLPLFSSFKMPIYLYWGPVIDCPLRLPKYLEKFAPSHTQISHLHELAAGAHSHGHNNIVPLFVDNSVLAAAGDNTSVPATPPIFPPVEKYSDQRPGEDWRSFFARREKRCAMLAEKETPEEHQQRRQREEHAGRDLVPGKRGARVYIWEDVNGFLIRRAAGKRNYEGYWEEFGHTQCRYNSFFDEWDICEEFDPTCGPEDEDDEDVGTGDDFPLLPDSDTSDSPVEDGELTSSKSDLLRIHNVNHPDDHQIAEVKVDEVADDVAYYRFGFVKPMGRVNESAKKLDWKTIRKWLGFSWREDSFETAPKDVINAIINFFGHLSCASKLVDIPKDLYDLRQSGADNRQQWNICVRTETFLDKQYYLVTPRPTTTSKGTYFELMLSSAASVVEITRRPPKAVLIMHTPTVIIVNQLCTDSCNYSRAFAHFCCSCSQYFHVAQRTPTCPHRCCRWAQYPF
jgi:hypothetical protein